MPSSKTVKRTHTSRKSATSRLSTQSHKVAAGNGYDLVVCLLELLLSVKFYHWRTSSYSTHKATDELYGDLNDNIDEFAETLMGAIGKRIPATNKLHLTIPSDNKHMLSLIDRTVNMLAGFDFEKLAKTAQTTTTDLMNMRDEMVGQLHKTKYLLSLNGSPK